MAKRKKAEKVVADVAFSLNSLQFEQLQRLVARVGMQSTRAATEVSNALKEVDDLDEAVGKLVDFFADIEEANDES